MTGDCTCCWCRLAEGRRTAEATFQENLAEGRRIAEEEFQKVRTNLPSPYTSTFNELPPKKGLVVVWSYW
jgi:hypothetical protein